VSVCAGRARQSHLLVSKSNTVHIVQTPSDNEPSFLMKVEGIGVDDWVPCYFHCAWLLIVLDSFIAN